MQRLKTLLAANGKQRELLHSLRVLDVLQKDSATLDELLVLARVHCLSKIELYFLQDASQLRQPLNLRNEAAVVSLLLGHLADERGSNDAGSPPHARLLAALVDYSRKLWPELANGDVTLSSLHDSFANRSSSNGRGTGSGSGSSTTPPPPAPLGQPTPPGSAAADFEAWARERGVAAAITIASFGDLRGCAASQDVAPGQTLLSIPADVLIYEDTVKNTDLGRMLHAIPGLTIDNLLIIFTMIDRHDEDSGWARYWRSLPAKYYTGMSFPQHFIDALAGTAAQLELSRAQQHLQQQYAATRPLFHMLLTAYPQYLRPEWFDYESYLWAAELWYSYAFEVDFPADTGSAGEAAAAAAAGGTNHLGSSKPHKKGSTASKNSSKGGKAKSSSNVASSTIGSSRAGTTSGDDSSSSSSKPVMVPFACHINHSPWPHCVRYGRVNPKTSTLDYPAFRPCQKGQQVFISYGPVPNLKLLCYYGFVVPNNPHDVVPLQLEPPEGPLKAQQLAALQALGLGLEHSLQDGPLSKQLLACLRVIVATSAELQGVRKHKVDPVAGPIAVENESQALRTLETALLELIAPLEQSTLLEEARVEAKVATAAGRAAAAATEEVAAGQEAEGGAGRGDAAKDSEGEEERADVNAVLGSGSREQAATASQEPAAGQLQRVRLQEAPPTSGGTGQEPPLQGASAADQQQEQQQPNENGFDADWCMSRRFCQVYLLGQHHILLHSLQECRRLMQLVDS